MKTLWLMPLLLAASAFAQVKVQGTGIQIGGTSTGSGTTTLTGPVTGTGTGTVATTITPTGVTAGNYNLGGQVLVVNAAGQITAIGNPFGVSMTACSACGTFEEGQATTSPATFTLSFSNGTAQSASISDGTTSDTLASPYTSGSIATAYCTAAAGQSGVTFTANATATNGQTASASNGVSCLPRIFGGIGAAGATATVTASTTSAKLSTGDVLASEGLTGNGGPGTYGPFAPSNQKIYLLLTSSGRTFTASGFNFPMNAPTTVSFTNQYGAVVTMYLYESTNLLSASYTIQVN